MKIVHAISDENKQAHGGIPGDQTGKEILEANWYKLSGSEIQYIECTDRLLASRAVTIGKNIASHNYGYSQDAGTKGRWSGYDAIVNGSIEKGVGNFDCSSFVLTCYKLAGLDIPEKTGYTRTLAKILLATGKFKLYGNSEHLESPKIAKLGSLYCTPGRHVFMCIEDGENIRSDHEPEPEPSRQRIRVKGSVRIREVPKTGKTITVAHDGDIIEVYGNDEETGWYKTVTGFITNNTRYVEAL